MISSTTGQKILTLDSDFKIDNIEFVKFADDLIAYAELKYKMIFSSHFKPHLLINSYFENVLFSEELAKVISDKKESADLSKRYDESNLKEFCISGTFAKTLHSFFFDMYQMMQYLEKDDMFKNDDLLKSFSKIKQKSLELFEKKE